MCQYRGEHDRFAPEAISDGTSKERDDHAGEGADADKRGNRGEWLSENVAGVDQLERPDDAGADGADENANNHYPKLAGIRGVSGSEAGKHGYEKPCENSNIRKVG